MDQLMCASLFPHPPYCYWHVLIVGMFESIVGLKIFTLIDCFKPQPTVTHEFSLPSYIGGEGTSPSCPLYSCPPLETLLLALIVVCTVNIIYIYI